MSEYDAGFERGREIDPKALARAIADVMAERYAAPQRTSRRGYYVPDASEPDDDELHDLTIDGRDDLVEICRIALERIGKAP